MITKWQLSFWITLFSRAPELNGNNLAFYFHYWLAVRTFIDHYYEKALNSWFSWVFKVGSA